MIIREATADDAGQIAPLINLIYDEMELDELEDVPEGDLLKVIRAAYRTRTYLSGVATTVVAVINQQIAGVAFGYPDKNETKIDTVLSTISQQVPSFAGKPLELDQEAFNQEWYLDSIAVDPAYQGQGVGSQLLKALPHYMKTSGLTKIGLNVDFANPGAKRLYQRHGFKTIGTTMIGDHQYYHMQLTLTRVLATAART